MSLDPQAIRAQVEQVADAVDRHFEAVFASVKSSFENSQWIPESVRPPPKSIPKPPVPLSYLQYTKRWIDQNRAVAAAILAFAGTTGYLLWQGRRSQRRKRRARRVGAHGAKVEAVVLAGPPESPLTRSLAHDLEKRGFLVYIPVEAQADEQLVRAEGRDDIRPLHLDLSSPQASSKSLTAFTDGLATVTRSQRVHVAALVIVPALDPYPRLPLAALSSGFWTGNLFVHLQRPVDLVHAFLPLLQAQESIQGKGEQQQATSTSVVVLSRGITSALPLPGHGTESVAHAALSAYLRTLKAECPGLAISHLQLGAIDLGSHAEGRSQLVLHPRSRSNSPPDALSVLGRLSRADMTPAKQLHYAVFDAITGRTTGLTFVGRGARTYAFVGKYGPVALVRWMMGGAVPEEKQESATLPVRRGSEEWEELNRSSESIREATNSMFG